MARYHQRLRIDPKEHKIMLTEAAMNRLVIDQGYLRPFSTLEEGVERYVRRLEEARGRSDAGSASVEASS